MIDYDQRSQLFKPISQITFFEVNEENRCNYTNSTAELKAGTSVRFLFTCTKESIPLTIPCYVLYFPNYLSVIYSTYSIKRISINNCFIFNWHI